MLCKQIYSRAMNCSDTYCLRLQVSHPDPGYQGFSDSQACPSFIADWDCRGTYIESQYKSLAEEVRRTLQSAAV